MDSTTILAISSTVVSTVGLVLGLINHKRVRSTCCGKEFVASVDVENTTPVLAGIPPPHIVIKVPE